MHSFSSNTNTNTSGSGAPPQLVRSTGIARRPRRPAPAPARATPSTSTTQPPAGAARRSDYRSEQDLLRGNGDSGANSSTTHKPTRAWRTWPTPPPTSIPAPAPAPTPPASLAIGVGVGAVGQQMPQIRHQLQSRRSFAARVEASTGPATAPRVDGGRVGGREGPDGEDEVALLTGGRIPRSFSTSAQTRVAAVHRRRGVEAGKGARRGGMGLPIISETTTVGHGGSAGGSRAAPAAVVAVPAAEGGGGGGGGADPPPRLPFLAFSGTGHLPLQDGDAAARAARKNALLAELYALETQSAAAGGGQGTDAHGVGTPHERERQIIAELMDLVHEYALVEENRYLPGEQRHDRERGQGGAMVELPAYDARSYTFPQPAYSRRPVWPGPQPHPQQQQLEPTQAPSPELYASEPWAVKPRRPGVPVIGLGNALHGRRQDEVYGEEGQSSRSFPANCSEYQVETLFRESMLEARQRRQEEEEAMMAEQRVGGLHEAAADSPSPSSSCPSSKGLSDNTAAAVGSGNADFAVEQTLPSIYMIRPTGREPPEPTIDPRYSANLDETRLTPPGAPKAKMRRRLAGLRGQGLDDAPEVVTAEMLGVPEIAAAEQKVEVEGAQCRSLEPGELPLPTMRRQGSGRQGLGARNSLKKSWRSFWNLR
ncbi:hypothetical protein IWX90DRAFT_169341 [Phyllosticta citrichinensis]|uniref:Uncharacterized protein n=1 Tax=Phyllosticta citrichinensis TaxID=1130410 RepID=A0ABR1Y147_9PEZI